jgi:hypothetical protein
MGGIALLLLAVARVVPWHWAVPIACGLFALRWFTESFYLVDMPAGRVLHSFWCLGFRRLSVAFEPGEMAAVVVTGRRCHGGKGWVTWWDYRIEAVRHDRRRVPLSDWNQDCVEQVNAMAARDRAVAGMQCHPLPGKAAIARPAQGWQDRILTWKLATLAGLTLLAFALGCLAPAGRDLRGSVAGEIMSAKRRDRIS